MQQDGEPSVEEILESIKQVIARDNRDSAVLSRQRKQVKPVEIESDHESAKASTQIDEDEVLDLGPESALIEGEEDLVEYEDLEFDDDNLEEDEIDLELDAEDDASDEGDAIDTSTLEGLTTASATEAMRQSLAALSMLSEPSAPPKIVRSGETSLEGLVRDLLRPMLAQWLEANLPEIVERHVKAEISRIAGKGR